MSRVARFFSVQSDEIPLVFLLFTHSFFVGMPRNLGNAVATANFAPEQLSTVLVISAILNTLVALTLNRLQDRFSFLRFSQLNLGIQFASMLMFFGAFTWAATLPDSSVMLFGSSIALEEAVAFVFFIWMQVIMVLSYKEYWDLAGRLLDIRQSKRLYGLIGAGEFLFILPVGLFANTITQNIGTEHNLLLLAAFGVVGSFLALDAINKRFHSTLQREDHPRRRAAKSEGGSRFKLSRYVLLIFLLAGVYALGFALTRQLYLNALEVQYPDDIAKNAFILQLLAATGLLNLIVRFGFSDEIFERLGVAGGLMLLPTVVLVSSLGLSAAYVLGLAFATIFAITILLRGFYFVLKPSIDRPASLILFQTLPASERQQALTIRDGVVDPLFGLLAGILLFILGTAPENSPTLAMMLALLVALWLGVVSLTLREYGTSVVRVLRQREVSAFSDLFQDRRNLERIKRNLDSNNPLEVIYALHVIQTLQDTSLTESARRLLAHPTPLVRERALQAIEEERLTDLLPPVMVLAQRDSEADIRARAVRTMAVLGQDEVYDQLMAYLRSRNDEIRKNAMIGLLRSGDLQGVISAGNALLELSQSENASERVIVADILGGVGNRNFYRMLVDLLRDEDIEVRRHALLAAGHIKNDKLWPLVIENLQNRYTRSNAVRALHEADESIIPQFEILLANPDAPPRVLITVTRICDRLPPEAVRPMLLRFAKSDNLNLRRYVLEALSEQGYRATSRAARAEVIEALREEVNLLTRSLMMLVTLKPVQPARLVVNALAGEIEQTKSRIFNWLSFIYESQAILTAKARIKRANRMQEALILEAMEQLLDADLRPIIIPVYEALTTEDRLARLNAQFPQDVPEDETTIIHALLRTDVWVDPWLQTTAVFAAPDLRGNYSEALLAIVQEAPSMVTETALWSLSRTAPTLYNLYTTQQRQKAGEDSELTSETIGVLADTIGLIRKVKTGGERVLLTIEKVLTLKEVKIFSGISEEFLAEIASLLEEVRIRDGDPLMHEGDTATHLYIVLDGVLEVRDKRDQVLATLGQYDIIGELSLFLDDPVHTATVVAQGQVYLLRLHRDDFLEILYDYSEIAHGLIRELAQRLQLSNQRVTELTQSGS